MTSEPLLAIADEVLFQRFGKHLSDVETAILVGAIADQTYEQIADRSGYSVSYVKRDVGPKLWRFLSEALGETISKTNFRAALERYPSRKPAEAIADQVSKNAELEGETPSTHSQVSVVQAQTDWGEAADVSVFYGRTEELKTLAQWIIPELGGAQMAQVSPCRLLAILGMGGIGKSALAIKLAQQLAKNAARVQDASAFQFVIWRSLRNAPPLETLLADLVPFLSDQKETVAGMGRLLQQLRDRRCLVILDNLETLLDTEQPGQFRSGYENYGDLLRLIGEINHQSCVILTSREKPAIIADLEGEIFGVRSLRLQGSSEIAQAILQARKLQGDDAQKQTLCDRYGNSPLALKIIATTIVDLFGGDIAAFLSEDTLIFNGIRRLLDSQFERLTALEQTVMYWLAINREWISIAELQTDILPPVSKARLLEALEGLSRRSLIEQQANQYTQQPVVMEYVTERLTTKIVDELKDLKLSLFADYALIKTTVKDYIRDSQAQLLVNAIASQFFKQFSSARVALNHINDILSLLRQVPALQSSYVAGNLLNLCQQAQIDLTGLDFSHLTIRHAYLRETGLRRVNLSHADLIATVFIQPFGNVLSLDFSPNGKWLATGDVCGQVRLWQVSDGQPYRIWEGHGLWTKAVCFSPDSTRLASGSYDLLVKLWDVETGQCLGVLSGHQNVVTSLAWSLDGRVLISVGWCTVKLWEVASGKCLAELETGVKAMITHIASHPIQDRFALCLDHQIQLWTLGTHEELLIENYRCIRTLIGHTALVFYAAWHPDGRRLATASDDQTLKVWNTHTGECLITLQGNAPMWAVLWLPDQQTLVSTNSEGLLQVWNSETGHCVRAIRAQSNTIWALISHPTRSLVAVSEEQNVKFWSTETWDCLGTLQGYDNGVLSLALSPDEQTLAVGTQDQAVYFWDLNTRTCTKVLRDRNSCTWRIDWQPQGQKLAVGELYGSFNLWDVAANTCLKVKHGALGVVNALAWCPDGVHLAFTTTLDYAVRIWNVETQECIQILRGSLSLINCLNWSPDGRFLATGGYDYAVRVWDFQTGECKYILQDRFHTIPWITWITWSPDSKQLASTSRDQTMRVWDITTGQCVWSTHEQTWFWTVEWSADGNKLVSTSQDGKIQIWNSSTGECLSVFQAQAAGVRRVLWAEQDSVLISGGTDGVIELWDAQTGKCLQTLQANRPYEGMNITGVTGITEAQKTSLIVLGAVLDQ
jgi:WD40 repeat protein